MKKTHIQMGLLALAAGSCSSAFAGNPSMLEPTKPGYSAKAVLTIGESIATY